MKYSKNDIIDPLAFEHYNTPYKRDKNTFNKIISNKPNTRKGNILIKNLSSFIGNFNESLTKICLEIKNNNLSLSNQISYLHYLVSVIKNKNSANEDIEEDIERLCNHLDNIDYSKQYLDESLLLINNVTGNLYENFSNILKNQKNSNTAKRFDSTSKSRNGFPFDEVNNKKFDINNFGNIKNESATLVLDKNIDDYFCTKINRNMSADNRKNNFFHSYDKNKHKKLSFDNDYNKMCEHPPKLYHNNLENDNMKKRNQTAKNKYSIMNNCIQGSNTNPYRTKNNIKVLYNNNNSQMNMNKSNMGVSQRDSTTSKGVQNISNIINNFYNNDKDSKILYNIQNSHTIKNESNNSPITYNKLELELSLKIIQFMQILTKFENNIKNNLLINKESKNKFNKYKNDIIFLSKNIIKKYNNNKNNQKINYDMKNANTSGGVKQKYESILLEKRIQNYDNNIRTKRISKSTKNNVNNIMSLKQGRTPNKKPIRYRNNTNELISQKLTDITKLSHNNSVYLIEINKLKKEKDSLMKSLEERSQYIQSYLNKNRTNFTSLKITHLNFYIHNNNKNQKMKKIKNEKYFNNNIIKTKRDNIEKIKKEIFQVNNNNNKLTEEIKKKDIEIKKLNEQIQQMIEAQKDKEKTNEEKIEKLISEKEEYINKNENNLNEMNNLKNIINDLQIKLNKYKTKKEYKNKNKKNNFNTNIYDLNNNNNSTNKEEILHLSTRSLKSLREMKEVMTPGFLSLDKESKKSIDSIELNNNVINNINIINDYEAQIKYLKESNNHYSQLNDELKSKNESMIKEINSLKRSSSIGSNNYTKINMVYRPEEYIIICDKNKDGLKWYLIKNKKYINDVNSYNNMFWVDKQRIPDVKKFNKFKSEDEEINEIIINKVKKLEEKENEISLLKQKLNFYEKNENNHFLDDSGSIKKMKKSKSEQIFKNKKINKKNNDINYEQDLDKNIKDDFSKNKYYYLEQQGLGLLDSKDFENYK